MCLKNNWNRWLFLPWKENSILMIQSLSTFAKNSLSAFSTQHPLCKISDVFGGLLTMLSIWSSRAFRRFGVPKKKKKKTEKKLKTVEHIYFTCSMRYDLLCCFIAKISSQDTKSKTLTVIKHKLRVDFSFTRLKNKTMRSNQKIYFCITKFFQMHLSLLPLALQSCPESTSSRPSSINGRSKVVVSQERWVKSRRKKLGKLLLLTLSNLIYGMFDYAFFGFAGLYLV